EDARVDVGDFRNPFELPARHAKGRRVLEDGNGIMCLGIIDAVDGGGSLLDHGNLLCLSEERLNPHPTDQMQDRTTVHGAAPAAKIAWRARYPSRERNDKADTQAHRAFALTTPAFAPILHENEGA